MVSVAPMTGADYYTAMSTLISGFQMDSTLFYQLLNVARVQREMVRPFCCFRKVDSSITVSAVSTLPLTCPPAAVYPIPTDFQFLTDDGRITLYDNNNVYEEYEEIPIGLQVQYLQVSNKFFIDYVNNLIYFCGIIDRQYQVFVPYQADFGDITATSSWNNVPSRFHMILALDVAAMYRLGIDYDDIQARNAESNAQQAEILFNAMKIWDDNRQRSMVTTLNYSSGNGEPSFTNRKINME